MIQIFEYAWNVIFYQIEIVWWDIIVTSKGIARNTSSPQQ